MNMPSKVNFAMFKRIGFRALQIFTLSSLFIFTSQFAQAMSEGGAPIIVKDSNGQTLSLDKLDDQSGALSGSALKDEMPVKKGSKTASDTSMSTVNNNVLRTETLVNHDRNEKRLAALAAQGKSPPQPTTQDVDLDGDGNPDVALIVDNGTIILPAHPANPVDLPPGLAIQYVPTGVNTFNVSSNTGVALDPNFGNQITFTQGAATPDDAYYQVNISFTFTYLGVGYNSIFIGSDGNITFGAGDGTGNSAILVAQLVDRQDSLCF